MRYLGKLHRCEIARALSGRGKPLCLPGIFREAPFQSSDEINADNVLRFIILRVAHRSAPVEAEPFQL